MTLHRKKGLSKQRKTSVAQAKRKAWHAFSLYIRKKDMNSMGYVNCYTCNKRIFWKESQCGHGIAGRGNAVLFEEDICRPQCVGCNVFQHGRLDIFMAKLINELGERRIAELLQLKGEPKKMTATDYLAIEEKYKCEYI